MRPSRRLAPAAVVLVTACLAGLAVPAASAAPEPREEPSYSFAVAPDIFNQDIGDVRGQLGWDEGDPNSWTPQLDAAVDTVLDEIAGHDPSSLLVPGDLVEGHWGRDDLRTGIFGPTSTFAERDASLRRSGNFYHSRNAAELASHGLKVHAAVGDHDLGDNPWRGPKQRFAFKRKELDVFRSLFDKHYNRKADGSRRYHNRPLGTPWSDTAYAVKLDPDVLLVTLDVFDKVGSDVRSRVVGKQLAWLERTLAAARRHHVRWVIVQGHVPVLTPVRTRWSSGLSLDGGRRSPLWQVMKKGGVDLYLCGEVHDTTMRQADGITQISTGTQLFTTRATYMTTNVFANRMDFVVHEFEGVRLANEPIWQGAEMKTQGNIAYPDPSAVAGTMTLTAQGKALRATGKLAPYHGG